MSGYTESLADIAGHLEAAASELEAVCDQGPDPLANHALLLKAVTLRHYALELRLAGECGAGARGDTLV